MMVMELDFVLRSFDLGTLGSRECFVFLARSHLAFSSLGETRTDMVIPVERMIGASIRNTFS